MVAAVLAALLMMCCVDCVLRRRQRAKGLEAGPQQELDEAQQQGEQRSLVGEVSYSCATHTLL